MTTLNAPSPQSSPRRGEENYRSYSSPSRERKVIGIPLSLEGEGQGEGKIKAYPAAHFVI
jgi:hypothetical protein